MNNNSIQGKSSAKRLKGKFTLAFLVCLITLLAVVAATYAWYIYNTGRHTTKVRMAAGTGINLQISNTYDSNYQSSAMLKSFNGKLNPVSTNRIQDGFHRATGFQNTNNQRTGMLANVFGKAQYNDTYKDYYKTSLFLRTNGKKTDIYISDIAFEDSKKEAPISSAMRVGFVVYRPGQTRQVADEYIFAISDAKNPKAHYNTATGKEGYVLDKNGHTTKDYKLYTRKNYCVYDETTGETTLKPNAQKLCAVSGTSDGKPGTPVRIDVYIWLEGCDEDCTENLADQTLNKLAISFAGVEEK